MPESEAPRGNGGRQAERPTRTEKAMQLRVRRDMGWPPAEKRATAATSSSRRLITTGTLPPRFGAVKKSFPGDELVEMRLRAQVEGAVVDRRRGHAAVGELVGGKDVIGLSGRENRRLAVLIGAVDLSVGDDW